MRVSLISYDRKKDINSRKLIPVSMFAEEVTEIELGLYVRWSNMWHERGTGTIPIGGFVNKHIKEIRGKSYDNKEELLRELPVFEEKYGISLHDFVVKTIESELAGS